MHGKKRNKSIVIFYTFYTFISCTNKKRTKEIAEGSTPQNPRCRVAL